MTRTDVLALLDRRREALAQGNETAAGTLYAEDARLESPLAGSASGREAIVRATGAFFSAFPGAVVSEEAPIIDGDRVAIVAEIAGTHVGEFLGVPPSGRAFRFPVSFVLDLRDHQIVHERRFYDFTGLLVQVGVLRAKPA
jgi:steroid delta-isomerase-like uncharacterized protein